MDEITRAYCADQLQKAAEWIRAGFVNAASDAIDRARAGIQDAQTREECPVCRGYDDGCPVCEGSGRVLWTVEEIINNAG